MNLLAEITLFQISGLFTVMMLANTALLKVVLAHERRKTNNSRGGNPGSNPGTHEAVRHQTAACSVATTKLAGSTKAIQKTLDELRAGFSALRDDIRAAHADAVARHRLARQREDDRKERLTDVLAILRKKEGP